MCQAVFFICNCVAVFLFQLWIQKRDRSICTEGVAVIVRNVVSESTERKRIAINVVGISEKSQQKKAASHVVRQVTEEKAPVRVIAHVLDNRSAVCVPVRFLHFCG